MKQERAWTGVKIVDTATPIIIEINTDPRQTCVVFVVNIVQLVVDLVL